MPKAAPTPILHVIPPTVRLEEACIPDTRKTVLDTIHEWLTATVPRLASSKLMWLADISGSGKSAVARHVAYNTAREGQLLCAFFFKRDLASQATTSGVIPSLAQDLANRKGGSTATRAAKGPVLGKGLGYTEAFHLQITSPLCQCPPERPSLILIDALDESGQAADRADFLAALIHEIPLLPPSVKVLVTSKPMQDISDAFNKLNTESSRRGTGLAVHRLTFDVYGQDNWEDLSKFVSHAFGRIARSRRAQVPTGWPSNEQQISLAAHANGLFLWVSVAADYVASATNTQQALDELLALENRPSPEAAMDALYKHILFSAEKNRGFDLAIYRKVLDRVLAAPNPITVTELTSALGRGVSTTISCLKPVFGPDHTVRIVHQSFREFVQDPQKCERRFLAPRETLVIDIGSPVSSDSGVATGSGGSSQDLMFPPLPKNRLGTIASYPHARHLAPDMSSHIDESSIPVRAAAVGAFGLVWRAKFKDGTVIAIKSLRTEALVSGIDPRRLEKNSVRELAIWSKLDHPNVLGLLGICVLDEGIGMVSEWMPNGNVGEYLQRDTGADRLKLIRDVTAGLAYLHLREIVHGDLKGLNIVVSADGTARLVDFGLARLVEESIGYSTTGATKGTAPELFDPNAGMQAKSTYATDVYALGMTMLEILTGQPPFCDLMTDWQVMTASTHGQRPRRPPAETIPQLSDELWKLIELCWHQDRMCRPSADATAKTFEAIFSAKLE